MAEGEDQQFCLRWNNFQANITSQFETLRDDEDFTDVTIACDGQRLQAHKVVLSACSPFFKELFKTNPCSHPIVFMRDVEARHIVALLEFMYAGEVNVAQAHLSTFLKTAESLKIRGLTDTSTGIEPSKDENSLFLNPQPSSSKQQNCSLKRLSSSKQVSSSSTVTSSQDIEYPVNTSPPLKRQCKTETESLPVKEESMSVNPFALQLENKSLLDLDDITVQPKVELPDYSSDDELNSGASTVQLPGGMEIIAQTPNLNAKDNNVETPGTDRKLHSLDPRPCEECGRVYSNLSNLRQHMKLIHFPTYVQCPICKKSFKTDLYLRRHMISSHDNANKYSNKLNDLENCQTAHINN